MVATLFRADESCASARAAGSAEARVVGAFSAGRIVNPLTARSQLMGGLIWGVSSALFESTEIDREAARYVHTDLAEYLLPVNADAPEVEVMMLPERDEQVNDLGICQNVWEQLGFERTGRISNSDSVRTQGLCQRLSDFCA